MLKGNENAYEKKLLSVLVIINLIIALFPTQFIVNAEVSNNVQSQTTWASGNTLFTLSNDTLEIKVGSNVIDLEACSSEILKVNYKPNGQESEDTYCR